MKMEQTEKYSKKYNIIVTGLTTDFADNAVIKRKMENVLKQKLRM